MKRTSSFIIALLGAVSAFAQPAAGSFTLTPKVGVTAATTGDLYDKKYSLYETGVSTPFTTLDANSLSRVGFVAGVEAGYQVSKRFAVTTGLLYSQQGTERDAGLKTSVGNFDDKSQLKLDYLNIPILANLYLFKGFAVKAGIQPGILLSAKSKNAITATGNFSQVTDEKEVDIKDYCNTIDFAIPVGISYEFSNIIIDARYNIGVTDILNDKASKEGTKDNGSNGVFQLTVGYKINL